MQASSVRYILCRWVDAVKNTPSMLKKLLKPAYKEDGDLPPDSTLAYLEMPGELEQNEQLRKAMEAPIDYEKLRKQL